MAGKRANGEGTIYKYRDGFAGQITVGRDPGTGKIKRKTIYGATQAEVRKQMTAAAKEIDDNEYMEPSKMTVSKWIDTWMAEYMNHITVNTRRDYNSKIKNHIKPYLGAVKVSDLTKPMIIHHYTKLLENPKISSKTVGNVHAILHSCLETLVELRTIKYNPADSAAKRLPKQEKREMKTLTGDELSSFMNAIKGTKYENVFLVDLFTGMRQGEILGLRWSCVDYENRCITIDKQLYAPLKGSKYTLEILKNKQARTIYVAPFVLDVLKRERQSQIEARLLAGAEWDESDLKDLVFTHKAGYLAGKHYTHKTVYKQFKKYVELVGVPEVRFHDMRHTFATLSLQQDPHAYKTISEFLGHASVAFTMDTYNHVTKAMQQKHVDGLQRLIESIK